MPNDHFIALLKQGADAWNAWRERNPPSGTGSNLQVDLAGADLRKASLRGVDLRWADLFRADLTGADLRDANLRRTDFSRANLSRAKLNGADLSRANLLEANLEGADLTGTRVYGVSAWNLKLDARTKQHGLLITRKGEADITADDIEIAQFLYLFIHNQGLRKIIDTITSKVVLILGRFSSERKVVLDTLRKELRKRDLLPVIFDFEIPASRDVTETVKVLAGLSRFVIADITDATEVRAELHAIVTNFPGLAIQPILLRGEPEFVSMSNLKKFPGLLPSFEYATTKHLLANLDKSVVAPAQAGVLNLRGS